MTELYETGENYLLGDSDEELIRLGIQHRVWAEPTYGGWRRAGFGVGDTLLDLGCGPGFTALELAEWVGPTGRIIAADQSERFLSILRQRAVGKGLRIDTLAGNAEELAIESNSLDGAYARWLFCFLANPGEVIYRLSTALKPGATFVSLDYFNYRAFTLAPRSDAMDEVVAVIERHWREQGGSLSIQGAMPGLLTDCGFEVVSVRQVSEIARPGSPLWAWPEAFLRGHLPTLVADKQIGPELVEAFWADWAAAASQPESYLCLPPLVEIQARKPLDSPGEVVSAAVADGELF